MPYGDPMFKSLKHCQTFSIAAEHFEFLPALYESSNFSTSSSILVLFFPYLFLHYSGHEEVSLGGFNLHFYFDCYVSFHVLVGHLCIFFGEMYIQVLFLFFFILSNTVDLALILDAFFKIYLFIFYLFMAVLGLRFCARAFSSCGKWGPLFITVRGPLLLRSTGSRRAGSVIVAHGRSCSAACGIFPDQGSNPCPLH